MLKQDFVDAAERAFTNNLWWGDVKATGWYMFEHINNTYVYDYYDTERVDGTHSSFFILLAGEAYADEC